jgi:hypothetical protein
MSSFSDGMWLTQEPPCRFLFQTMSKQNALFSFPVISVPVRFSQSEFLPTISNGTVASSSDETGITFRSFSGRVINSLLSGLTGVFFARKMHSTSEFAMTVLSKCVIHAGFVKVA